MMKLKHLFNNEDLALMALKCWDYDQDSLELFKYYRISANALYPFKNNGRLQYLRFSPVKEKPYGLEGEIEFLTYLKSEGYPVVELISSKNNHMIEEISTPWGDYYAVAFQGIQGGTLEDTSLNEKILYHYGELLGLLHQKSQCHQVFNKKRPTIFQHVTWIKKVLNDLENEEIMLSKIDVLEERLRKIPQENDSFGLIHFDYELDNVLIDKDTNDLYVIDFDDSMYSWYAMDVLNALTNLEEEVPVENLAVFKEQFLEGYRSILPLQSLDDYSIETLKAFNSIYKYTRVKRSLKDKWHNEPEWMMHLRDRLENYLEQVPSTITI